MEGTVILSKYQITKTYMITGQKHTIATQIYEHCLMPLQMLKSWLWAFNFYHIMSAMKDLKRQNSTANEDKSY